MIDGFVVNQNNSKIDKTIYGFIEKRSGEKIDFSSITTEYIIEDTDTLFAIYFNNNLFVTIKHNQPQNVLAFSFKNGIDKADIETQKKFLKSFYSGVTKTNVVSNLKKGVISETHDPIVQSMFGQTNCHNQSGGIINVTNLYTPTNVAVGCVAISLTTLLNYSQWPIHGSGQKTYTDNIGSLRGEHSANFEKVYYEWDNIKYEYDYKSTNITQRQALGTLSYHAAVALEMDFENGGSTSNINKIPNVLNKYFKHYGEYQSNSSSTFFDRIDSMVVKNSPVILAVSGNGYAHSIVCDGWKIIESGQKYYHLNMGWWGTSSGWYKIHDNFNAGGYSSIDGGVFNIVPTPDLSVDMQEESFLMKWDTPENILFNGFELQIKRGRNNWETLAEPTNDSTFQTENDMESSYAFRIRMKYNDFSAIEAWSNMVILSNDITGIAQNNFNEINIYPNPVEDILNIDYKTYPENTAIEIFDMFGKTIRRFDLNDTKTQIDMSDFISGGYVVKITNSKRNYSQIFIKK